MEKDIVMFFEYCFCLFTFVVVCGIIFVFKIKKNEETERE